MHTLELQSKPGRFCTAVKVMVGSMDGQHSSVEYRDAGSVERVTATGTVQVSLVGIGTHLKLLFSSPPKTS